MNSLIEEYGLTALVVIVGMVAVTLLGYATGVFEKVICSFITSLGGA